MLPEHRNVKQITLAFLAMCFIFRRYWKEKLTNIINVNIRNSCGSILFKHYVHVSIVRALQNT